MGIDCTLSAGEKTAGTEHRGELVKLVDAERRFTINLKCKPPEVKGFQPMKQRWVVALPSSNGDPMAKNRARH